MKNKITATILAFFAAVLYAINIPISKLIAGEISAAANSKKSAFI